MKGVLSTPILLLFQLDEPYHPKDWLGTVREKRTSNKSEKCPKSQDWPKCECIWVLM